MAFVKPYAIIIIIAVGVCIHTDRPTYIRPQEMWYVFILCRILYYIISFT